MARTTLAGPTSAQRAEVDAAGRCARIAGLRALADWLEAHPDVPVPASASMNMWGARQAEAVEQWLSDVGVVTLHESYFEDSHPALVRRFGNVDVSLYVQRETLGFPLQPPKPARGSDVEFASSDIITQMQGSPGAIARREVARKDEKG